VLCSAAAAEAAAQIEALTAQLLSVADFQQHQAEVEAEVMKLKEENQGLREKLETQRVDLERCENVCHILVLKGVGSEVGNCSTWIQSGG